MHHNRKPKRKFTKNIKKTLKNVGTFLMILTHYAERGSKAGEMHFRFFTRLTYIKGKQMFVLQHICPLSVYLMTCKSSSSESQCQGLDPESFLLTWAWAENINETLHSKIILLICSDLLFVGTNIWGVKFANSLEILLKKIIYVKQCFYLN